MNDNTMNDKDEHVPPAVAAVEWLKRLENASPREREAFLAWLKQSPSHVGAVLVASSGDLMLRHLFKGQKIDVEQFLHAASNVVAVGQQPNLGSAGKRSARWSGRLSLGLAAAACLLIAVLVTSVWWHPNEYSTAVGEQRALVLADGSVISMNAQSRVDVRLSDRSRDVFLREGQAIFTVAHDAQRPFRVHANDSVVQAIGTKFDVKRQSTLVKVAVLEGKVEIRPNESGGDSTTPAPGRPSLAQLVAGQSVSIGNAGEITAPMPVNVAEISAWQQRRLIFRDNTLTEIVDEFRRYNRTPQIRIEGDVGSRRYSGVFEADNPEILLDYFAADREVVVERDEKGFVIRARSAPAPSIPAP
jgi:transmembrane sensor